MVTTVIGQTDDEPNHRIDHPEADEVGTWVPLC
jgi:hypothetical protein